MKNMRRFIDPRKIGVPIEDSIRKSLRDPEYRRHYMRYSVRFTIAATVKSLRLSRGMTQKQLADRVGVPQSQIARLEGVEDERIPTLEHLVCVFLALDSRAALYLSPLPGFRGPKREIALV